MPKQIKEIKLMLNSHIFLYISNNYTGAYGIFIVTNQQYMDNVGIKSVILNHSLKATTV